MRGELIDEDKVECRPEKIPNCVLDKNVDVQLVRHYFTSDAWMTLDMVLKEKAKKIVWICTVCNKDLHSELSIFCDLCLQWYHWRCVGLIAEPKSRNWFCRSCVRNFT